MAPRSRSTLNIEPAMLFHDSAVLLFFCCIWYNDHEHTGLEVLERRREQIDRKKQETSRVGTSISKPIRFA